MKKRKKNWFLLESKILYSWDGIAKTNDTIEDNNIID